MSRMSRKAILSALAVAAVIAGGAFTSRAAEAAAAPNVTPSISGEAAVQAEAQRKVLFAKILADPGDIDTTLAYAELSAQLGDLEGAISSLERLAIFAPDVGRIKFELGVLYMRLASYDLAVADLQAAEAAPDATPDLKQQAASLVASAQQQQSGDKFSGYAMLGARYQTNANGGVADPLIDLNGIPFTLSDSALASPDTNGFVQADAHYSHDLASQGDRIDADVAIYGALYDQHHEIDTGLIEAHLGPVLNLERFAIPHTTLGVYAIGGAMSLQGSPYRYTLGAGAVITSALDNETQAHVRLEYRYEDFINSDARPTVSDMTGNRTRLSADLTHVVNDWLSLSAMIYGERKDAVQAFDADWEEGATADAVFRFKGPVSSQPRPWMLDLSLGADVRNYDQPDISMSSELRHDTELNAQAALTVPVGDSWSAVGTVGYRKVLSNYQIYTLDDVSTSLAVMKQF